jgi:outer membrane biosynthesis protein TonB
MANRHNDPFDDFEDEDDGYLTFDAREEEEGGNRTWLILAGAVLLVLVIGIVGYNLFMGGNRNETDAPVVAAAGDEFKQVPDDTAPVVPDDADKGVLADGANAPALAVEPLTGAEDPLLDGASTGVPGAPAPVPAPAPAPKASPPPPPVQAAAAPKAPPPPAPRPASPPPPPPVQKAAASPPPPPAARPASPPPPPAQRPAQQASASPPPPAARPASPPPPPPAASAAASGGSGRLAAQLGSFQTRDAAESALARYRAGGLGGTVSVVAADLGAKGTWYRIRATGFETRAEVVEFCAAAQARGVNCIPAGR